MSVLIYIGEDLLDLKSDIVVPRTLQSFDIFSTGSVYTNFSSEISVPKTENNIRLLGHSNEIESTSNVPYTTVDASIIVNGIQVTSGKIFVNSVDEDFFKLSFVDGIIDFYDAIENKRLSDLNLDDYDYDLSVEANINARLTNTSGMINAVYNSGIWDETGGIAIRVVAADQVRWLPCMYMHTLLPEIFSNYGFTLTGDFLTDPRFLKMAVLCKNFYDEEWSKKFEFRANTVNQTPAADTLIVFERLAYNGEFGAWDEVNANVWTFPLPETTARTSPSKSMAINFRCEMNVTVTGGEALFVMGGTIDADMVSQAVNNTTADVILGMTDMNVGKDESIGVLQTVSITWGVSSGSPVVTINYGTFYNQVATEGKSVASNDGSTVNVTAAMLPAYNIKDFLQEVSKYFGLVFLSRPDNEIEVKTIKSILTGIHNSIDWTDKFVSKKDMNFVSSSIGKRNEFRLSSFDGTLTLGEGFDFFEVDNAQLEDLVTYEPTSKIVQTTTSSIDGSSRKLSSIRVDYYDENTSAYTGAIPDCFVYLRPDRESLEVRLDFDSTFRNYTVAYINDKDFTYNHNWTDYLEEYYTEYIAFLQDIKVIKAVMMLDDEDIRNFDQSKLVYIKNSYYIVHRISKYITGEKTEVILIKA